MCVLKYSKENLPEGETWEEAHYPVPQCKGGSLTVKLWSRDHSAHGVIQSEDLRHPCLHHAAEAKDRTNLEVHYPEYIDLYDKWLKKLKSAGGKACIKSLGGKIPNSNNNPSHLNGGNIQKVHERRKLDPLYDEYIVAHCRSNGAKGGSVSGPMNRGMKWCNNGMIEKRYRDSTGLPEGFAPGRLPNKTGR